MIILTDHNGKEWGYVRMTEKRVILKDLENPNSRLWCCGIETFKRIFKT